MAAELEVKLVRPVPVRILLERCEELMSVLTRSSVDLEMRHAAAPQTRMHKRDCGERIGDEVLEMAVALGEEALAALSVQDFSDGEVFGEEAGVWLCISMNLQRTPETFLLTLCLVLVLAEELDTSILDDSLILGQERYVDPQSVRSRLEAIGGQANLSEFASAAGAEFGCYFGGEGQ